MMRRLSAERLSYYADLAIMLIRGTISQLLRLQFRGWVLLGRGGKIYGLKNLHLSGVIKIGEFATVDARFCRGIFLGDRFSLGNFSILRASGSVDFVSASIRIGSRVSFGPFCNIGGGYGLKIADDCVFGPYVSLHPEGHLFASLDLPIRAQGISGVGISIGADNWFGAKSTVLDGAAIPSGCVIGAATLIVAGSYASNGVYVGIPAKRVKSRA